MVWRECWPGSTVPPAKPLPEPLPPAALRKDAERQTEAVSAGIQATQPTRREVNKYQIQTHQVDQSAMDDEKDDVPDYPE